MKDRALILGAILLVLGGVAYLIHRSLFGYEVILDELDLGTNGELLLIEEWEDWEREGNIISLWYRPVTSSTWGVEQIEFWTSEPWVRGSLEYVEESHEVIVRGKGKEWTYSLDLRAHGYGDSGFLFDPEWQP